MNLNQFFMKGHNQTLDRMARSAVSRMLKFERPWRAPRHRSALRSPGRWKPRRLPIPVSSHRPRP